MEKGSETGSIEANRGPAGLVNVSLASETAVLDTREVVRLAFHLIHRGGRAIQGGRERRTTIVSRPEAWVAIGTRLRPAPIVQLFLRDEMCDISVAEVPGVARKLVDAAMKVAIASTGIQRYATSEKRSHREGM